MKKEETASVPCGRSSKHGSLQRGNTCVFPNFLIAAGAIFGWRAKSAVKSPPGGNKEDDSGSRLHSDAG